MARGAGGEPLADLGRLDLDRIELRRLRLPLREPFVTSRGRIDERDLLVVRVLGRGGEEGWGECVAESTPGYAPEYTSACWDVLSRFVVPDLVAKGWASAGNRHDGWVRGWPMARAALECAVLDALCRRAGMSLAAWLGGTRTEVAATLTVGLDAPIDAGPYRSLKLKAEPRSGVADRVRDARATGATVSVDANGSFRPEELDELAELAERAGLEVDHVEQPLRPDDLVGHAAARSVLRVPVALDESIGSAGDVRAAATLGACDIVNIKPGRVGGMLAARACHDAALAGGLRVKVGGMLETGIGRSAALAVAALPGCSMPADLSASERYWRPEHEVVAAPAVLDGEGRLAVPGGPGLGIDVVLDAVERATVALEVYPVR